MIFAQPKFNQFCLTVSCLVGLFVEIPATVCAHVYEDGFVERSLTITIRDGVGYGEYQIGLNSKTAHQIIENAEQLKQKNYRLKFKDEQLSTVDQPDPSNASQLVPPKKTTAANELTKLAKLGEKTVSKTEANSVATKEQIVAAHKPVVINSGEHLTDLATIKKFGDLQDQWFAGRLKLSSDGQAVELSKVLVEPAGRHPYSVLVKFQFSLSEVAKKAAEAKSSIEDRDVEPSTDLQANRGTQTNQIVDFQISDQVLADYIGAGRYALRARGSTMLLQSNVAPVLVRAERVQIKQKTVIDQPASPTIRAKLTVGN